MHNEPNNTNGRVLASIIITCRHITCFNILCLNLLYKLLVLISTTSNLLCKIRWVYFDSAMPWTRDNFESGGCPFIVPIEYNSIFIILSICTMIVHCNGHYEMQVLYICDLQLHAHKYSHLQCFFNYDYYYTIRSCELCRIVAVP